MQRFIKATPGQIQDDIFYKSPTEMISQALAVKQGQFDNEVKSLDATEKDVKSKIESIPATEKFAEELGNKYTSAAQKAMEYLQQSGDTSGADRILNTIRQEAIKDFSAGGDGYRLSKIKETYKEGLEKVKKYEGKPEGLLAGRLFQKYLSQVGDASNLEEASGYSVETPYDKPDLLDPVKAQSFAKAIPETKGELKTTSFGSAIGQIPGAKAGYITYNQDKKIENKTQAKILNGVLPAMLSNETLAYLKQVQETIGSNEGINSDGSLDLEKIINVDNKGNVKVLLPQSILGRALTAALNQAYNNDSTTLTKSAGGVSYKDPNAANSNGNAKGAPQVLTRTTKTTGENYSNGLKYREQESYKRLREVESLLEKDPNNLQLKSEKASLIYYRQQIVLQKRAFADKVTKGLNLKGVDKQIAMNITRDNRDLSGLLEGPNARSKYSMEIGTAYAMSLVEKDIPKNLDSKDKEKIRSTYRNIFTRIAQGEPMEHFKNDTISKYIHPTIEHVENLQKKIGSQTKQIEKNNKIALDSFQQTPIIDIPRSTDWGKRMYEAIDGATGFTIQDQVSNALNGVQLAKKISLENSDGGKVFNPLEYLKQQYSVNSVQALVNKGVVDIGITRKNGHYELTVNLNGDAKSKFKNAPNSLVLTSTEKTYNYNMSNQLNYAYGSSNESDKKALKKLVYQSDIIDNNITTIAVAREQLGAIGQTTFNLQSNTTDGSQRGYKNFSIKVGQKGSGYDINVSTKNGVQLPSIKLRSKEELDAVLKQMSENENLETYLKTITKIK